jgi:hypothetical protein
MSLSKITKLSFADWCFTFEAGLELLKAWFCIYFTPFSFYSRFLGKSVSIDYQYIANEVDRELLFRLKSAVLRFARRSPIPTRCLAQAIAMRQIAKRRGIDCEIFLGVKKNEENLLAHAWTKHGELFLTGAKGHSQFTVVGRFLTKL